MVTYQEVLKSIVSFGVTGTFTDAKTAKALAKDGLVEVNPEVNNPAGEVAVRATAKGIEAVGKTDVVAEKAATSKPVILRGTETLELPARATKQGKPDVYPFDELQQPKVDANGKAVFTPDTYFFVEGKEASKMQSTISNVIRRYAVSDPSGRTRKSRKPGEEGTEIPRMLKTRDFQVHDATLTVDGQTKTGVRVFRVDTANSTPSEAAA